MSVRSFWPPLEAAQIDYETLRSHLLEHGRLPDDLAAVRFGRRGLAGLISWPVSEAIFVAELAGASRPAWSPRDDPRVDALAAGYQFLLDVAATLPPESVTMVGGAQ
ncbi:hypothetical protein JCM18899A_52390 [Nocardioides sp. AN3]